MPLNSSTAPCGSLGGGVGGVGGEEAQRVVAPVVGQAPLDERRLGGEGVHGEQLDGGDAERR